MESLLYFFSILSFVAASVDFTSSTLYDIYDFKDNQITHIPKCDYGCYIFASTMGDTFTNEKDGLDPFAKNLFIEDDKGNSVSITELAQHFNETTSAKKPLDIQGKSNVWVSNRNEAGKPSHSIVVYVIDRAKANEFSYAVYDVLNMRDVSIDPNGIVTVMSAMWGFTVKAEKNGAPNSVTARLTGFDNVRNNNPDDCPVAFSTPKDVAFGGFSIQMTVPIISFIFGERNREKLTASLNFIETQELTVDGFISSAGYNGCRKPQNGGVQSFKSPLYEYGDTYILNTVKGLYDVSINVRPDGLDNTHKLMILDVTNNVPLYISDSRANTFKFINTKFLDVEFPTLKDAQGFVLQYTAVAVGTTAVSTATSPTTSPTLSQSSTESSPLPTTSSSYTIGAISWMLLVPLTILSNV